MKIETHRWIIIKMGDKFDSDSDRNCKDLGRAMLYGKKAHAEQWAEKGDKIKRVKVTVEYN